MWRGYSLNELFSIFYNNFVVHLSTIVSKYLLPNIGAAIITLVIFFTITIIRNNIKSKFFASLFTLILIFLGIFLIVLFAKEYGIYSLLFTFITIVIMIIENFKEL